MTYSRYLHNSVDNEKKSVIADSSLLLKMECYIKPRVYIVEQNLTAIIANYNTKYVSNNNLNSCKEIN